jgi:cell division protein FtsB
MANRGTHYWVKLTKTEGFAILEKIQQLESENQRLKRNNETLESEDAKIRELVGCDGKLVNTVVYARQTVEALRAEVQRLESELAELKERAIVPKFEFQQLVWFCSEAEEAVVCGQVGERITYHDEVTEDFQTGVTQYNVESMPEDKYWVEVLEESELFATEAEAQASLQKEGV